MTLTVYGDRISGNCLKVKWTAAAIGIDVKWIDVSVGDGETRTPDFLSLNPAGQVPLAVFDDGERLAQSNAIIWTLAERAGHPLAPTSPALRAKALEWMFWEQYTHEPAIAVRRYQLAVLRTPEAEIDPRLMAKGRRALALMDASLDGDWFVGDALSLADVALVAYTRVADEGGFDLSDFPRLLSWIRRAEEALAIPGDEGRV